MSLNPKLERHIRSCGLEPTALPTDLAAWQALLVRLDHDLTSTEAEADGLRGALADSSRAMDALQDRAEATTKDRVAAERNRLQAVMNAFSDGFCNMDLAGRLVSANPAAQQFLGPERIGLPLLDVFEFSHLRENGAPERRSLAPEALLRRLRDGRSNRHDEGTLVASDGRRVPVSVLMFPIVEQGGVTGLCLTFRDLSLRREAERRMCRLALAMDSSADAIYITDPQGRIEYLNVAFTRTTGWPPAQALGQTPRIFKSDQTPIEVCQDMWATLLAGRLWSGRMLNRRNPLAGGQLYWAQTTITPYTEAGVLLGFIAVQRDVSADVAREQHQAIDAQANRLRAEVAQHLHTALPLPERLAAAVRCLAQTCGSVPGLPVGVLVVLGEGDDPLHSQTVLADPAEALIDPPGGPDWLETHDPDLLDQVLATGGLQVCLECNCRPGAQEPPLPPHSHLLVPVLNATQPLGGLLLFTPPGQEQDPLLLQSYKLAGEMIGLSIAEHRAREAAERARRAAVDAAQAKSKFVANMSHEIRTPMNGVLGMLDMLAHTDLGKQQLGYVDIARGSAESLLGVINDILDFSKIEAGKMHIESIPFDVRATAEDVATLFSAAAQQKDLELACYVPADLPATVKGDPTRLRQVLTNIIGNAIKFTDQGEVAIRVEVENHSDQEVLLRFEVRDTGIGINPEEYSRLFKSFSQADASTTRRYGGTGLGLAISKQLVVLMGGEIGADSTPGLGSRFWFTLPLAIQNGGEAQRDGGPELSGERVLAVDDNETNRTILAHYLSDWGIDYSIAEDGFQALGQLYTAAAEGRPYTIALLDMQMPRMDGITLATQIKADPGLAGTRLVLITSAGSDPDVAQSMGIEYSVTKPLRRSVVHDILLEMTGLQMPRPDTRLARRETLGQLRGHLLLAEDNLVNQQVAVGMLLKLGIRVDVVDNGQAVLDTLETRGFDLILMDCQMPVLDGFDATRTLRLRESAYSIARTPVIAMTANAMQGDRELCLAADMDDYIPKPVSLRALYETLARWLQRREGTVVPAVGAPGDADLPVDHETLATLREIMDEGFTALLDVYLREAPKLLTRAEQAILNNDAAALHMAAHSLKSSSANIGGARLAGLAGEMEGLGRAGHTQGAGPLVGLAREELGRVIKALSAELGR